MGGIELEGDVLWIGREPNDLDRLAVDVSGVLDELRLEHVFVAGYVAVLAGRSRATEDIGVILDPLDAQEAETLADRLDDAGFWGCAMPLDGLHDTLARGTNLRVARDGEIVPNVEPTYASDRFDRASLAGALTAHIDGERLPIGPLELQIAYKLYLDTRTDFEDAVHLYTLFEESLSVVELESWVDELGIEDNYERLRRT